VPCERLRSGLRRPFLAPAALRRFGVGNLMGMFGGARALGGLISLALAAETRGLSLAEASAVPKRT